MLRLTLAIEKSTAAALTLTRIYGLQLIVFIVLALYFGQFLFIPFTIAILLTFILSPLINRLESMIGRFSAIMITFLLLIFLVGSLALVLSKQLTELAIDLPKYKVNIENKLNSINVSKDNPLTAIFTSIEKLESHFPGKDKFLSPHGDEIKNTKSIPVKVVEAPSDSFVIIVKNIFVSLLNVLGSTGLVFLLLLFMLFNREDMRGRLIRLIGPTRISSTTLAMNDAGQRITFYLVTQLLINFMFGIIIAGGLYLIGLPNALLWGGLAMVLRFIPYLGSWISALFPMVIALAISSDWTMPLLTLLLFLSLDLITGNIVEPILLGAKTGISSLALIVSAVFWTLLWGPIGLLLSTPLTVCIIVLGTHIPKLTFLRVLLSDEKGIALYEEFYHRLINLEFTEAMNLIGNYLKDNSLRELYDSTILPALSAAEVDQQNDLLDERQIHLFYQNVQLILDDIYAQLPLTKKDERTTSEPKQYSILCLPASNERDEIANHMIMQILQQALFKVEIAQQLDVNKLNELIGTGNFNAICISAVPPFLIIPAKKLARYIHQQFPELKIILGLWGALQISHETEESLKHAGVDYLVSTFEQAVIQFEKLNELEVLKLPNEGKDNL